MESPKLKLTDATKSASRRHSNPHSQKTARHTSSNCLKSRRACTVMTRRHRWKSIRSFSGTHHHGLSADRAGIRFLHTALTAVLGSETLNSLERTSPEIRAPQTRRRIEPDVSFVLRHYYHRFRRTWTSALVLPDEISPADSRRQNKSLPNGLQMPPPIPISP